MSGGARPTRHGVSEVCSSHVFSSCFGCSLSSWQAPCIVRSAAGCAVAAPCSHTDGYYHLRSCQAMNFSLKRRTAGDAAAAAWQWTQAAAKVSGTAPDAFLLAESGKLTPRIRECKGQDLDLWLSTRPSRAELTAMGLTPAQAWKPESLIFAGLRFACTGGPGAGETERT